MTPAALPIIAALVIWLTLFPRFRPYPEQETVGQCGREFAP